MIQIIQLFPCKVILGPTPLKLRYDLEFIENHTGIQINLNNMKIYGVNRPTQNILSYHEFRR